MANCCGVFKAHYRESGVETLAAKPYQEDRVLTTSCRGKGGCGRLTDIRHSLKDFDPTNAVLGRLHDWGRRYPLVGDSSIA
jgi:hypothetical protein